MKYTKIIATSLGVLLLASAGMAQTVFTPGVLRYQLWSSTNPNGAQNPSRVDIESGAAGAPESDTVDLTSFDGPNPDTANDYGDRISGLFIPPTTGKYVFFVNSDDDSDLFLNPTGSSPAGKKLIAQETAWAGIHQWVGGNNPPQKRSDTWKNSAGAQPYKDGIQLTAGEKYWIEAVHHEGGGGDSLSATYKLVGDADPANGTASLLTGARIGYGYTVPTSLTVLTQPTNTTAYAGSPVTFYFVVDNTLPDPLNYQWKRNGQNITNAVGPSYTLLATPADNAAVFTCVATVAPAYGTLSATSSAATLTVRPTADSVVLDGFLKAETYVGASRLAVENGTAGQPTMTKWATFEGPVDAADNYARRVTGFFIPPTTGSYIFYINTDDDSDLFINPTGTDPAGKKLVAQEDAWSGSRMWATGGNLVQKNSSTWMDPVDNTTPWAAGIPLTAGTPYYIEAVHREGGGGDNLAVTFSLVGGTPPVDGEASKLAGSNIAMITAPATNLNFTTQPVNTSAFEGQNAGFTTVTAYDGELNPIYQWYKIKGGNTTMVTNATGAGLKFVADLTDNGSQYYVVAQTSLSATSQVATLTVQQAVFEAGLVKYERFPGATRPQVEAGTAGDPAILSTYYAFEGPVNAADNFATRISGLVVPATTGDYVFIVATDDDSDLFLSTDATPANKKLIAQETGWAGSRAWDAGGNAVQKRSDTFVDPVSGATPYPSGVRLTAGQKYYIELVQHEGGGGDNLAVTMIKYGDATPANGDAPTLTGNLIGFNAPAASYVAFEQNPQSVTTLAGTTATFTAKAVSDSTISIGGDPNQLVMYQWYKGGTAIAGATKPSYTTPLLAVADSGQILVGVRALGIAAWSNSAPATLTVLADSVKPTIQYAAVFTNAAGEVSLSLSFSELMDSNKLAQTANYIVPGASVTAATVDSKFTKRVVLTLSGSPTLPLNITVNNVTDFYGNALETATAAVQKVPLKSHDVGTPGVDPIFPSLTYVDGPDSYTISAQGSDIWAAADGFNYMYEQKTGNFDVVVRQKSITHTSHWAKGGLMVRETLDAGSRNWNIVNTPLASDGIMAPDNSGFGSSAVEANRRDATDVATNMGWDTARGAISAYPNAWVRLARTNSTITAYISTDGVSWTQAAQQDATTVGDMLPLPATLYVGIAVTAHNNDVPGTEPYRFWNTSEFADYNSNFVPAAAAPTMSLSNTGGVWKITYQGTLQSSATADGTYGNVSGAVSPYTVDTTAGTKFFRARW